MTFLSSILAQAAETEVDGRWITHPQLPVWVLVAGFVVAGLASFYLYRAQSRIASKRIIVTLTTLRTLLILLMFAVLLGPGCQFTHRGSANGTLWLLLDRSASMAQLDPQATPLEKLRWADAAGFVPADVRASTLDRQAARLAALTEDLEHWQGVLPVPVEDDVARKKLDTVVAGLKKWNVQLNAVADAVEKDPRGKDDGKTIKALRTAVGTVNAGIDKIDARTNPTQAVNDVPWNEVQAALESSATALKASAEKYDKELLARNDPRLKDAMEKVAKLSRARQAMLALTEKSKRAGAASGGATVAGFEELIPRQNLKIVAFGDAPQTILPERNEPRKAIDGALGTPDKPATDMVTALRLAGDQIGQSEPASIVILGDGRQNKGTTAELTETARRLAARGVRTYAVAFGSEQVAPDAAVESIDAPDWVFKGDTLKLSALLRLDGLSGKTVDVELHRTQSKDGQKSETLIDTEQLTVPTTPPGAPAQVRQIVSFNEKRDALPDAGLYDYEVRIKDVPDEVVQANNRQAVRVSVREDKLTVLMIEDQPRWEYRYVENYLKRDNRVRVQSMLLQPAKVGRGDKGETITPPPPRKPSTDAEKDPRSDFQILPDQQEEWYQWKLIVLGDLPPDSLPKRTQEQIVKAVTDGGATLLVMAGPLNMPNTWGNDKANFPLAELFPVEPNPEWTPQVMQAHMRLGYHPTVAPDGAGHLLTQFGIDEPANDRIWTALRTDPDLSWFWHSEMTQAKGGANVIWSIADKDPAAVAAAKRASTRPGAASDPTVMEDAQKRALLATMNVGLGKVLYLSGDATWRWRQVNGQNLHERFWGQVIRWVVGGDLPAGGQYVRFGSDKPRYVGGESAIVTAKVLDKKFAPLKGQQIKVVARTAGATGGAAAQNKVEAEMVEVADAPGMYRAVVGNLPNGQVELSLVGPEVEQLLLNDPKATQKTLAIDVQKGLNLEQRNVNPDRNTLAAVAEAGGGVMLDSPYADVLAEQIPELNYQTTSAEQIGLFTSDATDKWARRTHWAFLGLFVALVSAEWIIRKVGGLV